MTPKQVHTKVSSERERKRKCKRRVRLNILAFWTADDQDVFVRFQNRGLSITCTTDWTAGKNEKRRKNHWTQIREPEQKPSPDHISAFKKNKIKRVRSYGRKKPRLDINFPQDPSRRAVAMRRERRWRPNYRPLEFYTSSQTAQRWRRAHIHTASEQRNTGYIHTLTITYILLQKSWRKSFFSPVHLDAKTFTHFNVLR